MAINEPEEEWDHVRLREGSRPDPHVLVVEGIPRASAQARISRDTAVDLMEGSLSEERDELTVGQGAGADVGIEIYQAATGRAEFLIIPADFLPKLLRQEQCIALG